MSVRWCLLWLLSVRSPLVCLFCKKAEGFTFFSFGVIKAFLEADLLPRVITGTSAGGLCAALLCTRTDSELKELLVPELADKITACSDPFTVWFKRFRQTGARFDTIEWARKVGDFGHREVKIPLTRISPCGSQEGL